jgi:retron-type reverse transcriptase
MDIWNLLTNAFRRFFPGKGHGVEELARRLGIAVEELHGLQPTYREFTIPKKSGGSRLIRAPDEKLKAMQRRILRRLFKRLRSHPAAVGFERGQSIVTNARAHVGKAVVVRMDLKDFFPSTKTRRVRRYFRKIGWNRPAADLLVRLCTYQGGLPQGAPTSPRLSNLVNFRLDVRLQALAKRQCYRNPRTGERILGPELNATYTRYADDLTFSFSFDDPQVVRYVIRLAKLILRNEGYTLHLRKKLHIRRRHDCQLVTGLVVNERVNLPRKIRRWLRAVEHRHANGRQATLRPEQLRGWQKFHEMIARAGRSTAP